MAKIQVYPGGAQIEYDVIIPEFGPRCHLSLEEFRGRRFPVLWLLHAMGCNGSDWPRFTQIETFANENSIIVVCPTIMNAFYTNEPVPGGTQWQTIITDELWDEVHGMYPTSSRPQDNYVAGNSMGGYGALKYCLSRPDRYACGISFSSCLDIPIRYAEGRDAIHTGVDRAFGEREHVKGGENDLLYLAQKRKDMGGALPRLYISCGRRDKFFPCNVEMRDALRDLGYEVTWDEGDFAHDWRFWNAQIEKAIHWMLRD